MTLPSLLYFARSTDLMHEVAERLGHLSPGGVLREEVWSKHFDIRRTLEKLAKDEEYEEDGKRSIERLLWHDDEVLPRDWFSVSGQTVTWLLAHGPVPPFLTAWRHGEIPWPFAGQPVPREFLYTADPLLRLRALLPDWPAPGYDRERIHLDALEQLESGLLLARADRYDLLTQVLQADGAPLLDGVRTAFQDSVDHQNAAALRNALVPERRARDFLFRTYATEDDPEPDEPAFAVDWDAVRTAAQRNDAELLRHGPTVVGHPHCPPDVRRHAAMHWRDQFVWSRLLTDRHTGRALLRELPIKPDLSLAVPLGYAGPDGVGAQDVLELAHPADLVLRDAAQLPGIARHHPLQCVITEQDTRGSALLCKAITDLTDQHLGENTDTWTNACRLIRAPGFSGTVTRLLHAATS